MFLTCWCSYYRCFWICICWKCFGKRDIYSI